METKRHREERRKVRRSATKLATKKTPKFWMGRKVCWINSIDKSSINQRQSVCCLHESQKVQKNWRISRWDAKDAESWWQLQLANRTMKKALRETQTLRAGCSGAEPKNFAPPQTPFPGAQDGKNLISWRWSLPLPTDPVWWGSMDAISSYHGNRPTNKQTQPQTHRRDRMQHTAPQLARSVMTAVYELKLHAADRCWRVAFQRLTAVSYSCATFWFSRLLILLQSPMVVSLSVVTVSIWPRSAGWPV